MGFVCVTSGSPGYKSGSNALWNGASIHSGIREAPSSSSTVASMNLCSLACVAFVCLLLLHCQSCVGVGGGVVAAHPTPSTLPAKTIQYYSHSPPPTIALPPVILPSLSSFGSISIVTAILTQDVKLPSKSIGYLRGMEIATDPSPLNSTRMILWTITYDDGLYSGTIQIQGQNLLLSVVGGTGSFTAVRGYLNSTLLATGKMGFLFHHVHHYL